MIDQQKLKELTNITGENCISFYLPTHRVDGIQEDKISYKNMLAEVSSALEEKELSPQEINKLLRVAKAKLEEDDFWRHLSDTLAVFIYDGKTEFHTLPVVSSPYKFIGNQLYLLPLLPLVGSRNKFYTLALSQNEVRVFEGTDYTLAELEKNDDFPENLAEILRIYEGETTLQNHSGDGNKAVFHGQGAGKDMENARLEEYLRGVDKGIETMSCDDDKTPLVLYSTPTLAGIYRNINTYPHFVEDFVEGNPENVDMMTIHEKSWRLLAPSFIAAEEQEKQDFELALANEEATFDLPTIVTAAMAGQVKTLFLVSGQEIWGKYDANKHSAEIHETRREESQPLYNDIALAVHNQGGTVHIMEREEMPRPTANANAIFFYQLATA